MKYYCIGIKGAGMSTLAQILYDLGNEVSGYDDNSNYKFTQDGLDSRGIKIYYDNIHDIDKDTIVTYSVAFDINHKELVRVREMGLVVKPYAEIMGTVIEQFSTIGVSGTHGKTSTSSMVKQILDNSYGCNYFIGAGDGKASLDKEYYVVESDEYNRHFLYYHPKYSIITNIEEEHMEIYKDIDDLKNTFEKFANQTKELVVANGDNDVVRSIKYNTKVIFYGFNKNNDVVIKDLVLDDEGSSFYINYLDTNYKFKLPIYGKHMVMNAVAAIIICLYIGVDIDTIEKSLLNFKNAKRRMETRTIGDTIIIDDYAHHPTEIKVTLEAIRQKYPNKILTVIFRPNTYSRVKDFYREFASSLLVANHIYLTKVSSNRESSLDYPNIESNMIGDLIVGCKYVEEDTINILEPEIGNVVCFMGCADNSKLISGFIDLLK